MTEFFHQLVHFQPSLLADIAHDSVRLAVAVLILVAGWWVSNRVSDLLSKTFTRTHIDPTLTPMLASVGAWGLRALAVIAALSEVGIATASVLAVLGAAGLAIGLALQGTLQNIAAGIMLLILRPFRAGDVIEGSGAAAGIVREVGLFTTRLERADGNAVFVPNSQIWSNPVINYSLGGVHRIDVFVDVPARERLDAAVSRMKTFVADQPRILNGPTLAPTVFVDRRDGDGKARLRVSAWIREKDTQQASEDLQREACDALAQMDAPEKPASKA